MLLLDAILTRCFRYGSSANLVLSTGSGVNGYTLDASLGEFILTHPNVRFIVCILNFKAFKCFCRSASLPVEKSTLSMKEIPCTFTHQSRPTLSLSSIPRPPSRRTALGISAQWLPTCTGLCSMEEYLDIPMIGRVRAENSDFCMKRFPWRT